MFRAIAGVLCLLAFHAHADPVVRFTADAGRNSVDVSDGDGGTRATGGLAARANVVARAAPTIDLGLALGIAHIADRDVSSTRYANPSLGVTWRRPLRVALLRAGFTAAVPAAEIRVLEGIEYMLDYHAFEAAARVGGRWDAWLWIPEWASFVAPASIEVPVAERLTFHAAVAAGVSYSTGTKYGRDGRRALLGQAAVGAELAAPHGMWFGGRILAVGFREPDHIAPARTDLAWEREDVALDAATGVRFDQVALTGHLVVLFADPEQPAISVGVETWR